MNFGIGTSIKFMLKFELEQVTNIQ